MNIFDKITKIIRCFNFKGNNKIQGAGNNKIQGTLQDAYDAAEFPEMPIKSHFMMYDINGKRVEKRPECAVIVSDIRKNGASTPEQVHRRTGICYENCKKHMSSLKYHAGQSKRKAALQQKYGILLETGEMRKTSRKLPAAVIGIVLRGNYEK